MNIEALNKTIALMEKDVSETGIDLYMPSWVKTREDYAGKDDYLPHQFENHACKTTACIAGYAVLANGGHEVGMTYSDQGRKILGLGDISSERLFMAHDVFKPMSLITKPEAIKVLKHLRDTGLVDWSVIGEVR